MSTANEIFAPMHLFQSVFSIELLLWSCSGCQFFSLGKAHTNLVEIG